MTGRDCKHGHMARACEICDLEAKLAAAEEELFRFRNGYKGSCYACETVGEKNVELEAKLAAAEEELARYRTGYTVRILREALDAISESEWDASAGLLRDIANRALAMTAPERGMRHE